MTPNLPGPPRFGDEQLSTQANRDQLYRWLNNVYQRLLLAASVPQAIAFQQNAHEVPEGYSDRELPFLGYPAPVIPSQEAQGLAMLALSRPQLPIPPPLTGDTAATTATLQNSWVAAFVTPVFSKDLAGNVWVAGAVGGGAGTVPTTVAVTIFTLPVGYRPARGYYFQLLHAVTVTVPWTYGTAAIQVLPTGEVQFTEASSNVGLISLCFSFSTL